MKSKKKKKKKEKGALTRAQISSMCVLSDRCCVLWLNGDKPATVALNLLIYFLWTHQAARLCVTEIALQWQIQQCVYSQSKNNKSEFAVSLGGASAAGGQRWPPLAALTGRLVESSEREEPAGGRWPYPTGYKRCFRKSLGHRNHERSFEHAAMTGHPT